MSKQKTTTSIGSLLAGVERLFLQVVIGLVAPILLLLIGWWGSLPFVAEESIKFFALGGLLLGILLDLIYLRRWVQAAYRFPKAAFVLVYLFYSLCLLGFFMGLPLFNLFLGAAGGYYVGLCLRHQRKPREEVEQTARQVALFSALVLALVCLVSWLLAFSDAYLVENIQGLLRLPNPPSRAAILGFSALVGIVMVVAEYFITRAMLRFARFL